MTKRLKEKKKEMVEIDIIFHHNLFLISVAMEWNKKYEYFEMWLHVEKGNLKTEYLITYCINPTFKIDEILCSSRYDIHEYLFIIIEIYQNI